MSMIRSILSISSNKVLNNVLLTIVSGKYVLIPLPDVFTGMNELRRKKSIHLILIDIDDQNPASLNFIQHLATSWLYQRPIIVLASDLPETLKQKFLNAGANALVKKPFNPLELV